MNKTSTTHELPLLQKHSVMGCRFFVNREILKKTFWAES